MNNSLYNSSIYIILNQFKNDHITEDEAVRLIEDLYKDRNTYVPVFPSWPQITYTQPDSKTFEVTCKQ